ncbi:hypothetical protein PIGHUM_04001 [Pigmentiphaga humi]|uniref:Methylenetetrahydrofolate reductase n=1 Tax=Pigmentiphaga humi TaxID=2478468 RepID=A0A3P4B8G0_9BURK|nr:methylenetetrahydrofolate reductase [Pigmentiphaga humi]VCU71910.1 hypothetical protein PIGHUM_04001 [Pigmentiphaga humi]
MPALSTGNQVSMDSRTARPDLDAIKRLAAVATIETSTREESEIRIQARRVAPGSDVYIPWLPDSSWRDIVAVAAELRACGVNPVPHVAARRLLSREDAQQYLSALRGQAGVTRALLIGGEHSAKRMGFAHSIELLESGLIETHGIRSLGFAGHPEGHPAVASEVMDAALQRKIAYADEHDLEPFIVTQFAFDHRSVLSWLEHVRAIGIRAPVRLGVTGPASVRTLLRYALRCGIGTSLKTVAARGPALMRLIEKGGAEDVVRAVAPRAAELGVIGLHLFPFGGFELSAGWIAKVAAEGL